MTWKLIGEIIGLIAICENIFIFAMLRQDKILRLKFLSDFLWFSNMLCLGAYTGALLNLIGMGREGVFYYGGARNSPRTGYGFPYFFFFPYSLRYWNVSGREGSSRPRFCRRWGAWRWCAPSIKKIPG